jgi:hypothetical protein
MLCSAVWQLVAEVSGTPDVLYIGTADVLYSGTAHVLYFGKAHVLYSGKADVLYFQRSIEQLCISSRNVVHVS